ncbi:hypothetical protein PAMP_015912 [Pampus punctatissimus]
MSRPIRGGVGRVMNSLFLGKKNRFPLIPIRVSGSIEQPEPGQNGALVSLPFTGTWVKAVMLVLYTCRAALTAGPLRLWSVSRVCLFTAAVD